MRQNESTPITRRAESRPRRPLRLLLSLGLAGICLLLLSPAASKAVPPRAQRPAAAEGKATSTYFVFLPLSLRDGIPPPPAITVLRAEPAQVYPGESAVLSWSVSGSVDSLTLDPGPGDVTGQNSAIVWPTETVVYTLTATNCCGSSAAQVTIGVWPPPVITRFESIPDAISPGDSATLLWRTTGEIESLTLEPGVGDVTGQANAVVSPAQTTTYTLTARNRAGSATAEVVVAVQAPVIYGFAATPHTIDPGESATLSWSTSSPVDSLTLEPGVGDVTGQTSTAVSPGETTTYTLTADNSAGSTTAEVVVSVRPPAIHSFSATPGTISPGDSATLNWSTSSPVDSLTLEPGVGDVTGQSSALVWPTETTTYTLTAHNSAGNTLAHAVVAVQAPLVHSFVASPPVITAGGSAVLYWSVDGSVTGLHVDPDVGDVTGESRVTVAPGKTTTYTLTATNSAGSSSAQTVVTLDTSDLPTELLVYDWNKPVTKAERGFPRDIPPIASANGNWTAPRNFAEGTLYFRVEIRSQPVPQEMNQQFCFWQYNNARENCGNLEALSGTPGTVHTWQTPVKGMYKKDGIPMDWANPRDKAGVSIKDSAGVPVSDYLDWNWAGQDPDEWYPLDMRFTVVVVANGATFSGWDNYVDQPEDELLVYDWNKPVTKETHGYGWETPLPTSNGDWTAPVNYAGGTLHYRVEIRSQPLAQEMRLRFCAKQNSDTLENCGTKSGILTGNPGTVLAWSSAVGDMWKQDDIAIDWSASRSSYGLVTMNRDGVAVTDLRGENWLGEDPDEWYPLDLRFTVVAVAQGNTFAGWDNWIHP